MIRPLSFLNLCVCLTSFKLLFLKSYSRLTKTYPISYLPSISTDFDVHRNWLAITYNLPLKEWYFDTTSEWTLDYPPLFAAFERILATVASLLNVKDSLKLSAGPIRNESIIVFQKLSVIFSDLLYYYAVHKLCRSIDSILTRTIKTPATTNGGSNGKESSELATRQIPDQNILDSIYRPDPTSCVALLLLVQPGLLLVDHIHFQYNGLLSAIQLISVADLIAGNYVRGSIWFALLLNFKHIYLYCAPAYGMYLLTGYCLVKVADQNRIKTFLFRTSKLGSIVAIVFGLTYSPFCDRETLKQILSRLFPFKRGLTHAYWAPNVWSLYNLADKLLATIFRDSLKVKFDLESISRTRNSVTSSTSGLAQEYEHQYLPTVKPPTTFLLVAIALLPIVVKFLFSINKKKCSPILFVKGLTMATFTSFMFGWHVHEKAIILVLLAMTPICFINARQKAAFLRLTLAGTYSLFPLLFQPAEYITKLTIFMTYLLYARSQLLATEQRDAPGGQEQQPDRVGLFKRLVRNINSLVDNILIGSFALNELYFGHLHGRLEYSWNPIAKLNKYTYLPLMASSSLSAIAISISYLELYYDFLKTPSSFERIPHLKVN